MKGVYHTISASVLLLILSLFAGCGGGTVGTDDGASLKVSGTVLDSSGAAVSDALVIVEATGDSARSDAEGRFKITTQNITESRLRIDAQIAGADISLTSEPLLFDQSSSEHAFAIIVSVEEGLITVKDLDVQPVAPTPPPKGDQERQPPKAPEVSSILRGVVRNQHGETLRGVRVAIEGDRNSAISTRDGSFEVAFSPKRSRIGILFEYQKRRARISISNLPEIPSLVRIDVALVVLDEQQVGTQADEPIEVRYAYRISTR